MVFHCKKCGRRIKKKYYYKSGLCYNCYFKNKKPKSTKNYSQIIIPWKLIISIALIILLGTGIILLTTHDSTEITNCENDLICYYKNLKDCNSATVTINISNYPLGRIIDSNTTTNYYAKKDTTLQIIDNNKTDSCQIKTTQITSEKNTNGLIEKTNFNQAICEYNLTPEPTLKKCYPITNEEDSLTTQTKQQLPPILVGCENPGDRIYKGKCIPKIECSDGTLAPECSTNKPLQCTKGKLIENPEECGCPPKHKIIENKCISIYKVEPKNIELTYTLRGKKDKIELTVYKGLNDYLASISRSYTCYNNLCPSDKEIELRSLNETEQKKYLKNFVEKIKEKTTNQDDQARIAISLVQEIPYDWDSLYSIDFDEKYPYEVLYNQTGVCGEKSKLLAFILRDLNYGVALFEWQAQHMATGIKCSEEYDYLDSGYCFIESTTPTIITYDQGDYITMGKLDSPDSIIKISTGNNFESVSEEYQDARTLIKIYNLGQVLSTGTYNQWEKLVKKYGLTFD